MESSTKRFRIPTLDEMENTVKEPIPLFKRRKEQTTEDIISAATVKSINCTTKGVVSDSTESSKSCVIQIPSKFSLSTAASVLQGVNSSKPVLNQGEEESSLTGNGVDNIISGSANDDAAKGPTTVRPGSSNSIIVNARQRGNPILKSVRNIPWEYGNIVPDYVMGQSSCALFLSLRYHQLHPNYIHERLKLLGRSYDLRVMLVQVDVKEAQHILKDLAKICLLADCTLILAFSAEEAGRYLETYKIFENKPPEAIMEKTEENFMAKFTDCLTTVKSVNRTDCATLISRFRSLVSIIEASEAGLSLCPGFGPQKAKRLYNVFHEPFLRSAAVEKH